MALHILSIYLVFVEKERDASSNICSTSWAALAATKGDSWGTKHGENYLPSPLTSHSPRPFTSLTFFTLDRTPLPACPRVAWVGTQTGKSIDWRMKDHSIDRKLISAVRPGWGARAEMDGSQFCNQDILHLTPPRSVIEIMILLPSQNLYLWDGEKKGKGKKNLCQICCCN